MAISMRLLTLGTLSIVLTGASLSLIAKPRVAQPGPAKSAVGETIYLKGVLGSGAPLVAAREGAEPVTGEQAACVNCHRRSGAGGGAKVPSSSFGLTSTRSITNLSPAAAPSPTPVSMLRATCTPSAVS